MNKYILLVLGLALALLATACAPAATPAPTPAASTEANKAIVRRYFEQVLNGGKFDTIDQFVAPNYKRYLNATDAPLNVQAQIQRLAGMRAAFPDLQLTIDDMIAEGDRVAIRGTARGTHKGPFLGIPPTGKQGTVAVSESLRLENGKIVEHWGGTDNLSLLQQLGAVISPPPAK